jgi:oxygen-independent coproporphyrinogen-3 oxidase
MYALTQDLTASAGMPAYEISNHARPGAEAWHNLIYWRGGDYVGIGPGAHGRITRAGVRWATETPLAPGAWLSAVEDVKPLNFNVYSLSPEDVHTEYLMMSLRLIEGTKTNRLTKSRDLSNKIISLVEDGQLRYTDDGFAATPAGRPVLNAILRELLV